MKRNGKQQPVRERFEQEARRRRHDPDKLLAEFMKECLQRWADEQLDEQIGRQARRSSLREADAVTLVREARQKRRRSGAT